MSIPKCLGFAILCSVAVGCSGDPARGSSKWSGYTAAGKASYYANKFQGRKTASGERYDKAKRTAAHRKLPFGTKVKVTNVRSGKTVIVRINDRGPFVKGRVIDLSRSAFIAIAKIEAGVIEVKLEVLE